jgi:release factor glutamine methyltransferase
MTMGDGSRDADDKRAEAPWTIRRVLAWAADDLRARGSSSPRLDAELLLCDVLGTTRVSLIIDAERPLSKDELARYKALHQRRRQGEPVAYLRGVREFYGRAFRVDRRVLVPRPETEILVEVALERTRALSLSARTLDLCTGSGCVAVTIAKERPTSFVMGADLSKDALVVARENAIRLGAVRCGFVRSDLFAAIPADCHFDLVTANPPYIPRGDIPTLMADVRDFEPRLALDGGPDGLDLVRRIVEDAPRFLAPGGVLAMEIGAGEAPDVRALFEARGFQAVDVRRDYGGHERIVSGVRGG